MISSGTLIPENTLSLVVLGGLNGAFLQHASSKRDFIVHFGIRMAIWLFSFDSPLPELGRILAICLFAWL